MVCSSGDSASLQAVVAVAIALQVLSWRRGNTRGGVGAGRSRLSSSYCDLGRRRGGIVLLFHLLVCVIVYVEFHALLFFLPLYCVVGLLFLPAFYFFLSIAATFISPSSPSPILLSHHFSSHLFFCPSLSSHLPRSPWFLLAILLSTFFSHSPNVCIYNLCVVYPQ